MDPRVERLSAIRAKFEPETAAEKAALLEALGSRRVRGKKALLALHEAALFLRAYPDDARVLGLAEAELSRFAGRVPSDGSLDETGVAGSSMHCAFSWPVVLDLRARYPRSVSFWLEGEDWEERFDEAILQLLPASELEAVADGYVDTRAWLKATGGGELLRRAIAMIDALDAGDRAKRAIWAGLEVPLHWSLGSEDGSRTMCRVPSATAELPPTAHESALKGPERRSPKMTATPVFQRRPFSKKQVQLSAALRRPDCPFDQAPPKIGQRWLDAARSATNARLREMYTFVHGNPHDVLVVELDRGIEIAFIGVLPEQRLALRTFYGYLLARNGVPIGYGDLVLAFGWGELNFHIYETFRGAESSAIYAGIVRAARQLFGLEYLFLNRYQFGWHNEDAIRSGAFWFYEKLGFRPRAPGPVALWRRERRAIAANPQHRTSPKELRELSSAHMGFALQQNAGAIYQHFHPATLGLLVSERIERDYEGDRRRAQKAATARLTRLLPRKNTGDKNQAAIQKIAPILDLLDDLEDRLDRRERSLLARALAAKHDVRERPHLELMQRCVRLRAALVNACAQKATGKRGADGDDQRLSSP